MYLGHIIIIFYNLNKIPSSFTHLYKSKTPLNIASAYAGADTNYPHNLTNFNHVKNFKDSLNYTCSEDIFQHLRPIIILSKLIFVILSQLLS